MENLLTKEEFNYYFNSFKEGNLESRQILILKNLKLIDYVLNKYINTDIKDVIFSYEDLYNYGVIGLVKAVDTFDITKNNSFSSYATKVICNSILLDIRTTRKDIKFDISIYDDKINNSLEFYENYDQILDREYLKSCLTILDEREYFVITNCFGIGGKQLTLSEMAKYYNCSINFIHILKKRALKKNKISYSFFKS